MLSIAVCDDELIECCGIAGKVKKIMEEMKLPCILRQFSSGQELLSSSEGFDIIFLDILMRDLDGMQTAQLFREKAFDKIDKKELTTEELIRKGLNILGK